MNIRQMQTLFDQLQREAGDRGAVIEARLDGDPDGITCRISLLDRPDSYIYMFLMDGLSDEYYVEMLIRRVNEITEQVAA